jgi:hypothetical protein
MNTNLFYTFLLLFLFALLARWFKSKEAEWLGSLGEYKVRKEINKIEESSEKGVSNKSFLRLIDAPFNVLETLIYRCL